MKIINLFYAIAFAVASGYIIFTQDHSVVTGANALQYVGTALFFAGGALLAIPGIDIPWKIVLAPMTFGFLAAYMLFLYGELQNPLPFMDNTVFLRVLIGLFISSIAATELAMAFEKSGDLLELRISAGIGLVFSLLFLLVPMDDVNTVGFLSAYFAISAVQRAIWLVTPDGARKNA